MDIFHEDNFCGEENLLLKEIDFGGIVRPSTIFHPRSSG